MPEDTTAPADISGMWTRDYPQVVVNSSFAESITTAPGSVFEIPMGYIQSSQVEAPTEFMWTSDDGRRTPISQLEYSHLCNIIKMLSRSLVGIDENSRKFQRNNITLELMREEKAKRDEGPQ